MRVILETVKRWGCCVHRNDDYIVKSAELNMSAGRVIGWRQPEACMAGAMCRRTSVYIWPVGGWALVHREHQNQQQQMDVKRLWPVFIN